MKQLKESPEESNDEVAEEETPDEITVLLQL